MVRVESLYLHPVKSCAAISCAEITLDRRGPLYDRRWMVVDREGRFVTQRGHPRLALVRTDLTDGWLGLSVARHGAADGVRIAIDRAPGQRRVVTCWKDRCEAVDEGDAAAEWLSELIGQEVRLVRMADDFERRVDPVYATEPAITGFSDGFPLLVIGSASLDDLNARLDEPLPMNRFRPNLVVAGSDPYAEDRWRRIRIGAIELELCKPCTRCAITTTDQDTGIRGVEPLRTLATYRAIRQPDGTRALSFGRNAIHRGEGRISIGSEVEVLEETL